MAADRNQLNLKLAPEQMDVLRAAVYVRDLGAPKDLVMPLLSDLIEELKNDEAIRLALEARTLGRIPKRAVVKRLPSRPTLAEPR